MKKLIALVGLLITCAVFSPIQASGWSPGSYKFGPIAQTYFNYFYDYSWPTKAPGFFTGGLPPYNLTSGDGDQFTLDASFHVCIPKPYPWDGCIWEADYVNKFTFDFNTRGTVQYNYNIPFTADFRFPREVYPGQLIEFAPTFNWSGPTINTSGNYEFYFMSNATVDAPFDFLGPLTTTFNQYARSAHLELGLPTVPFAGAISLGGDCTVWYCAMGGGEWGGSFTKLGGTGTLNNSGGLTFNITPADVSVGAQGNSEPAWKQGHEQFELIATVLTYIPHPATIIAGQALNFVRQAGEFKLYTQLDASIFRTDTVNFQFRLPPSIIVPAGLKPGEPWKFTNLPVNVKYRVQGCSSFSYPFGFSVIFDMLGIDQQTLLNLDTVSIPAGGLCTDWVEKDGFFYISGSVPVVQKEKYRVQQLVLDPSRLSEFTIPPYKVSSTLSPYKPGLKIASLTDVKRAIRQTVKIPFPVPTARQGVPAPGQSTVILGTASQVTAEQIINALKTKGIDGFMVAVPGSQDKVITLGSFANAKNAQLLSNMLKEALAIDNSVSQVIDSKSYVPIKSDVLLRLSK